MARSPMRNGPVRAAARPPLADGQERDTASNDAARPVAARAEPHAVDRRAIDEALVRVAGRFPAIARDTILLQNRFKHIHEIGRIHASAGRDGAVCDLGGGLGVNLLALRELGCTGRFVIVDRFDDYDEGNHMGRADEAFPVLADGSIELVRRDFWRDWQLPLDTAAFQAATCFDVFEHLPGHPMRQLAELRRALVPGGTFIMSVPNGVSAMKRLRMLTGQYPYSPLPEWLKDRYIEHYREYTRGECAELLERAGFDDVQARLSSALTFSRARHRYHRGRLGAASPRLAALWGLALLETAVPSMRHSIYASGRRPADDARGG
jgi:SAM-dependent methyltransferase